MSVQVAQSRDEKRRLLATLPPGTKRVQVVTGSGKTKFKRPDEVAHDDQINLNAGGVPIVMRGSPGRKAKTALDPATPEIADVMQARAEHTADSELYGTTQDDPGSSDVFNQILEGMAAEATALEFERKEAERLGHDTSAISSKRARVLKAMADSWLKHQDRLASGAVDMESAAFQAVFLFILESFRSVLEESGFRAEAIETVFTKISKRIDDAWKQEARARMRETV
jgi:hypothetical protein